MSIFRALTLLFLFALAWGAYAAEFKVTLPDGRKYKVTAPVDASDDEVYESALIFAQQEEAEEAAKRAQKTREKANSGIVSRIRRTMSSKVTD